MSAESKKNLYSILQEEISSREKEEERLSPSDLLSLPDNLRDLMLRITRSGEMTLEQLTKEIGQNQEQIEKLLSELVEKGYLRMEKTYYRVAFGRRRSIRLPKGIWESLNKKV